MAIICSGTRPCQGQVHVRQRQRLDPVCQDGGPCHVQLLRYSQGLHTHKDISQLLALQRPALAPYSNVLTFDTSSQLFNIFVHALLRMLTSTEQNQGISHGWQIGKDQDDSSQDANHSYQFNNIDDISIFAETSEGIQTWLDVVQRFKTWCGMEIEI